ncbi:MAG: helix-turn-helix domain-containing protein [Eubacterium sp.]
MDAKKFGTFIAQCRKEKGMTQSELANKINVTDKAISRWERGIGFPDINTIEPLADALHLNVLEVMKSERIEMENCSEKDAIDLMKSTKEITMKNRNQELTATVLAIFTTIIVALLLWIAAFANFLGSIFWGAIVSVPEICIYYYMDNRDDESSRKVYAIIGTIAILFIIFLLLLCILV